MRLWANRPRHFGRTVLVPAIWCLLTAFRCVLPARAEDIKVVPISTFAAQVAGAGQLIRACGQNAAACDTANLPARQQVQGGPGGAFYAGWDWLREGLNSAKAASAADRRKGMEEAQKHLVALAAEAGAEEPIGAAAEFGKARAAANAALAREEFRATEGPTWMERQIARLQDWILRLFTGMDRLGKRAPWLAPSIEWGCFGLAAAGLLWFVRQSLARQALRISLTEGAALGGRADRGSADWARLAQERAAAEDWREAIHCLYWAAIALMEARRAWRPNATRTPREYLRLLEPESGAYQALRELTRTFERIWYGHADADESKYAAALGSFQRLESARPERSRPISDDAGVRPVPAGGGA